MRVLVEGVIDSSVCVQIRAVLKAFVLAFSVVLFCLDMGMSCKIGNVGLSEARRTLVLLTSKMFKI